MQDQSPALLVFAGGANLPPEPPGDPSPPEHAQRLVTLVGMAQQAATLDLLLKASRLGLFNPIILATTAERLAGLAASLHTQGGHIEVVVDTPRPGNFNFGTRLLELCREYNLTRVVYAGGGAMPLGGEDELAGLAQAVGGDEPCVVANNLYSADTVAFFPASALEKIELPAADNDLAWRLHYAAGLPFAPTPRTLATQYDLDTPSDIAALSIAAEVDPLRSGIGPHLSQVLAGVEAETPLLTRTLREALGVMSTRRAELLVAGRVSSWVWRRLETNLPCQSRIFSEERGMRASGREASGQARSLLGMYAEREGPDGLIAALGTLCDAAFVDTRVLFAHMKFSVSPPDRFASDALLPEEITHPWVRALTEAALSSHIPLIFGGHSLVSGGIWALSERVRNSPH